MTRVFPFALMCQMTFIVVFGRDCKPTPPDIIGPYYFPKPPKLQQFCTGDPEIHRLKNLLVHGHVYKEDCSTPIPHVRMEIWQADHEGNYKMSADCRGHFKTDKHGYYEITTIHPGKYSVDTRYSLYRPIHLHFKVFGRRRHKSLVTQMYFAGDSHLGRNDSCQVCSSDREDLIIGTKKYCHDNDETDCIDIAKFDIVLEHGSGTRIIGSG
jgi:protocatechuate 3,4-dioxygenase beta subunit